MHRGCGGNAIPLQTGRGQSTLLPTARYALPNHNSTAILKGVSQRIGLVVIRAGLIFLPGNHGLVQILAPAVRPLMEDSIPPLDLPSNRAVRC